MCSMSSGHQNQCNGHWMFINGSRNSAVAIHTETVCRKNCRKGLRAVSLSLQSFVISFEL